MHVTAIIVAAGKGTRAGGPVAKQWQPLAGQRVIDHTLRAFQDHPAITDIVIVVSDADFDRVADIADNDIAIASGGATRTESVRNGLAACPQADLVLIHDGARPCVSADVISGVCAALGQAQAAAPGLPITDALWHGADGHVVGTQDRSTLFAAQTPQGFDRRALLAAYAQAEGPADDDVAIARAAGMAVAITAGAADNIKITMPADFARAARVLESRMDIRTGNGFDVHAFGPGDYVTLCGVTVPHDRGLVGHSDADVGLHTVTDAIYGALAAGDIGTHFPPSDPQWKGAASDIFLRHAKDMARDRGFTLTHVDCTLICEQPKIGPHAAAMRDRLADILGVALDRVSVKATTSERLGFTGREEGIACLATATLVKS
ncbi:bifunctional 2-C-methyl-D-erythritol 4-phosphate cytidylyltransferase/2-C-methyl-D-erythritol 2,4-cyclodiphosphate synthase [Sulfitobacter sp. S190]|uniref:bifunctional 2-C-methyl-D-erythritol 4-phosphate cytidylyltransferase/2-C-methyl-D-erythritol 2,4-cyclodiphosphate synthase n=1 Tax=Sulfitobacter sp. S190 TaxID=2867022 RepID=UPI0021A4DE20|nr:bifunctional 2-C-methyl-D-erythritol 4-phosphate cytidylyltransferase/2-C-methyl-D-erythritol 2,4-cyclodiphosphate synthase [Sulfitobacter sp. S190]UWR24041.1 bifunctional 2-C-methyl-D-erythritol 4-phosphate cytidylyltransferase/2-C-methyl-D-erythritol 2,4-cyclodiphosphate synthase [Sulfitobacter sp. S190]